MNDEMEVRDIKGAMHELLDEEGLRELGELLGIKEAWGSIVGEDIAGISKPYRLEKRRLYIGVASHARVQDMLFRVEDIKKEIKKATGIKIEDVIVRNIKMK